MSISAIFPILLILLSPLATSSPNGNALTAYEILVGYNFPIGVLPMGVIGYDLDAKTGKFHVYLNGSCSFSLEGGYQLKYKPTITGVVSDNRLSELSGVSVKVLFLWLNIVEVVRDGDELQFYVGIASANFPIDNFYVCPQCGCGLDCDNGRKVSSLITNPLVSSA
ncbi:hypothetical protein K2173_026272 [Erythroxylum novogranatense]|uniref:Uncharacterized protein n=1 Tax=Erythroxylum novogranatense TaxID=1862640 RepID=A0AAV8SBR3_9ROSI|nr:hypothetical protein K2173_026272 [Erythroxylum novogranatense]